MELTFTNADWADVGLLDATASDWAFGADENDFEIMLSNASGVPDIGALIYDESGVLGGIVRGYESEYSTGVLRVLGDTWTGILDRFTLVPPSGQAYFSVSGTLQSCVQSLINRLGVGWLFTVSNGSSQRSVSHTFKGNRTDSTQNDTGRFMGGWAALWQLVSDNGCKAVFSYDAAARKVVITAIPRHNYTDAESIDAGVASVNVSNKSPVNHLICLGDGEGAARTVLHLYMNSNGQVSTTQTLTGRYEISDVYDFASSDDLRADGTSKLKDMWSDSQTVKVGITEDIGINVGDLIGGTDVKTGVYAEAIVTKKVVSVEGSKMTVSYESTVRG